MRCFPFLFIHAPFNKYGSSNRAPAELLGKTVIFLRGQLSVASDR